MPLQPRTVDFSTGQQIQIVEIGQRIDGLTVMRCPRGLVFGIRFGNNPIVPGFTGKDAIPISTDRPDSDTRMGVWIVPTNPAPGLSVDFMVSFVP